MSQIDTSEHLKVTIPKEEDGRWFDAKEIFLYNKQEKTITLEHSLASIYKWETKTHKIFLDRKAKTIDETMEYIRCMTIEQDVDPNIYWLITQKDMDRINKFINDPMTATVINDFSRPDNHPKRQPPESAEVIYWEMIQCQIPIEWEHRHFNQLRTLLQVCEIKNQNGEHMSAAETNKFYRELNDARRKKYHTKG